MLLILSAGAAACGGEAPVVSSEQSNTEVPEEFAGGSGPIASADTSIGTPMAERVATIGLLNKRNNISQDIQLSPGESRRMDDVIIRLSACEQTPPWETPPETGAFVQVLVEDRVDADSDPEWLRVFSGWLFKNSPALNVVEHPVYDVWVKDCAMSFPGDAPIAPPEPVAAPSAE